MFFLPDPYPTLALAGGGLKMGQDVGESSEKVEIPKTTPMIVFVSQASAICDPEFGVRDSPLDISHPRCARVS